MSTNRFENQVAVVTGTGRTDREGLIPQASVERLEEIGKGMDANGESIYGSGASPFAKLPWGRCTRKRSKGGPTLYLHVFEWPAEGNLLLPGLESKVKSAQMLVGGAELKFEKTANGVVVDLPTQAPDANASVIKMEIAGKPKVVALFIKPAEIKICDYVGLTFFLEVTETNFISWVYCRPRNLRRWPIGSCWVSFPRRSERFW